MADIIKLLDNDFIQIATPSNGDLKLEKSISATDTSLTVSFEPKDETGASITKDFFIQLTSTVSGKRYTETMTVTNVATTKLTVTRGIARGGIDFVGSASNAIVHNAGAVITANLPAGLFQSHDDVFKGIIGTGTKNLKIGDGTTNATQGFEIDQGLLASTTKYGADASGNALVTLPDGSSFIVGAGVGSIVGGDGIDITASNISVDLGVDPALEFVSNKLEAKVKATAGVIKDADGLSIDQANVKIQEDVAVTATSTEINDALDGISGNVTAGNLSELVGGGNTVLHAHADFTKFIQAGEAVIVSNVTEGLASGLFTITILRLDDGVGGTVGFSTIIPEGAVSISSIKISHIIKTTGNMRMAIDTTSIPKAGSPTTDSLSTTTFAIAGTVDDSVLLTIPSSTYNGLTITAGNILNVSLKRQGQDASDTLNDYFPVLGIEIIFA